MLLDHLSIPRRLALIFAVLAGVVLAAQAFSLYSTARLSRAGAALGEEVAPLGEAVMGIKLTATQAHLFFEEIMAGDEGESVEAVYALLGRSSLFADAILKGATIDGITYHATPDADLRRAIGTVVIAVDAFLRAARERHAGRQNDAGAGSPADVAFDASYETIIEAADRATARVHAMTEEAITRLQGNALAAEIVPVACVILLLLLLTLAWSMLARGVARRITDLATLAQGLAKGRIDTPAPDWTARDEIGTLATEIEGFRTALRVRLRLENEGEQARRATETRVEQARNLIGRLENLADGVAAGDLSLRLGSGHGSEELDRLAAGVNRLVETVANAMTEITRVLTGFAESDLTRRMDGRFQGAFASLQQNANRTAETLSETLGGVLALTTDLREGSQQLSQGSRALAERAETQAASLEQTSATMEDMAGRVRATADRSGEADARARAAAERAEEGEAVVTRAVGAMRGIEESSHKITDIISVIDSIAFQTNLLALNAAVEAARAGDAGKGFAVVASEVRTLAQRSSEAARDISNLIRDSSARVAEGVELAEATGSALSGIRGAIVELGETIGSIAAENRELSNSVQEMKSAIEALDSITQQNATMADETAATTQSLDTRIAELSDRVGDFRIDLPPARHPRAA